MATPGQNKRHIETIYDEWLKKKPPAERAKPVKSPPKPVRPAEKPASKPQRPSGGAAYPRRAPVESLKKPVTPKPVKREKPISELPRVMGLRTPKPLKKPRLTVPFTSKQLLKRKKK
jgi:hypothetical protein